MNLKLSNPRLNNKIFFYFVLIFIPIYIPIDFILNKNVPISIFFLGFIILLGNFKLLKKTLINSDFLIIFSLISLNFVFYFYIYYQGNEYFYLNRYLYANTIFLIFVF